MQPKPQRPDELSPTKPFVQPLGALQTGDEPTQGILGVETATEKPNYTFLAPPRAHDEIGRLGGYRILRLLGEGGMGCVFHAEDVGLQRAVALKVMKPEIAAKANARERFLREGRAAAKIKHDHIITIYQVGEDRNIPFLALEYLEGMPLDAYLKQRGEISLGQVIRIGKETAAGLQAAHARGLIHRDIKPANIWLESPSGRVKILDFGLARQQEDDTHLTNSGAVVGTPAYMSPEQARAQPVDQRTDLFSLGVMLYRLCTGRLPFSGSTTMAVLTSLAVDEPPLPSSLNPLIPPALQKVIQRLLEKSVEKRFHTAQEVVDALAGIESEGSAAMAREVVYIPVVTLPNEMQTPAVPDVWNAIDAPSSASSQTQIIPDAASVSVETDFEEPVNEAPPRSGIGRAAMAVMALLLLLGGGLAGYQLLFTTPDGTLSVEVDGDADVRFKNGELQIYDADGKLKYTLKPSEKNKALPPGKYLVKVTGADGVKLETSEFTMDANGKVTLRVTAEVAVAKKNPPKIDPTNDTDRKAAEYALSIGGGITIVVNDQDRGIATVADLPGDPFQLKGLNFSGNKQVNDAGLVKFKDCKNLSELSLWSTKVSDVGLVNFKNCKSLTRLDLGGTQLSDAGLANFKDCKNLAELHLWTTKVSDAGLANFKDCKNLTHLNLGYTQVTDTGLAIFKECKNLELLLLGYSHVSDTGLANFKECKNLAFLGLEGVEVTNAGLAQFSDCKKMTRLDIRDTQVGDAGMEHLMKWKELNSLILIKTKVTAEGVKRLVAALPQCKIEWDGGVIEATALVDRDRKAVEYVLSIGGTTGVTVKGQSRSVKTVAELPKEPFALVSVLLGANKQISDAGMAAFKNCINLEEITIHGTKVGDVGVEHLKDCSKVTILNLTSTRITDAGLVQFKNYKNLNTFLLTGTKVSSAGLAHLKECKKLATLHMHTTEIGDEGLEHLKELTSLRLVGVKKTKVTAEGVKKLAEALPECQIESDHGTIEPKK